MKRLMIFLCLFCLAALPSCGLFGDEKDSKPDVEMSQLDTDHPDKPKPDRDE